MDPDAEARLRAVAVGRDVESRLGAPEFVRLLAESAEALMLWGDAALPSLWRAQWALGAARLARGFLWASEAVGAVRRPTHPRVETTLLAADVFAVAHRVDPTRGWDAVADALRAEAVLAAQPVPRSSPDPDAHGATRAAVDANIAALEAEVAVLGAEVEAWDED